MLSKKFSTNPESFKGFGRGRRIGWRLHMDTPIQIISEAFYFYRKILLYSLKGETTDLDHSKLKINHVNSKKSLQIILDH
jgi:hypothetical protein